MSHPSRAKSHLRFSGPAPMSGRAWWRQALPAAASAPEFAWPLQSAEHVAELIRHTGVARSGDAKRCRPRPAALAPHVDMNPHLARRNRTPDLGKWWCGESLRDIGCARLFHAGTGLRLLRAVPRELQNGSPRSTEVIVIEGPVVRPK